MTNTEASNLIRCTIDVVKDKFNDDVLEALDMAISALEDLTESETFRRGYVEGYAKGIDKQLDDINSIRRIPSVTQKSGKWSHDGSHWENRFICSECNYKLFDEPTNYCPNCGACMKDGRTLDEFIEDSEESEDKE